ncbi:MAG: hypothetical protein KDA24_14185 [Deltaproteobacteria bacterium]|nr:hypothetical protein [Deltaproteobacteria bacterium]
MRPAQPWPAGLVLLALLSPGCPSEPANDDDSTVATDDDDSTAADDDDSATGDDDDSSTSNDEPLGQITAVWWAEDALFDWPDLTLHAVLSRDAELLDAEDAVGRLSLSGAGVWTTDAFWPLPNIDEGSSFIDEDLIVDLATTQTLDAGLWMAAGDVLTAGHVDLVEEATGLHTYEQGLEYGAEAAELQSPGEALTVTWDGGPDVAPVELEDALFLPVPPALSSVDPMHPLPLRAGEDLVLGWTAEDPSSSVVITAYGPDGGQVLRVPDDEGDVVFTWEELAPLGGDASFAVARLRTDDVATPQGVLTVRGVARQYLYGERVGAWSLDVPTWPVGVATDVQLAWWDGALTPAATLDAGPDVTFTGLASADTTANRVTAQVSVAAEASTGPRTLTVTDSAGSFVATEAGWVVAELPHAGLCEDAVDEGDVLDGAYLSADGGLIDSPFDTSECADTPSGRDQAIPVSLQAGERLTARLRHSGFGATMYLVGGCDDTNAAFPCVAAPNVGPEVELVYQALSDEDLLLVVDSRMGPDALSADFVVDIRRDGPFPFSLDTDFFSLGAPLTDVPVWSTSGDWTQGDLSFDFGPDITVSDVTVPGGTADYAEVDLTVDNAAAVGSRPVSITTTALGTVSMPDALDVGDFIYSSTCSSADFPVLPGTYQGSTSFAAWGETSGETCLSSTAGSEALLRVDLLPGETLFATANTPGWDGVLYVLESCDPTAFALSCTDADVSSGTEYLQWTGPAAGGTVWLVLDGVDVADEGEFELTLEVRP